MTFQHTEPSINGIGAFVGGQLPGALMAQKSQMAARFALQALDDDALLIAMRDELRRRHGALAGNVARALVAEVTK